MAGARAARSQSRRWKTARCYRGAAGLRPERHAMGQSRGYYLQHRSGRRELGHRQQQPECDLQRALRRRRVGARYSPALATWEDVANINITQVGETGAWPLNTTGQTQGDPRFGDIRFGGTNLNDSQMLAQSYSPPPTGALETIYGNVEINTVMPWNIGSNYDLYSVMLHETGLTLGLSEPPPGGDVVMNTMYGGVRTGLMPGDIAGIQTLYGPRELDAYQSVGRATGFATAVDVSSALGEGSKRRSATSRSRRSATRSTSALSRPPTAAPRSRSPRRPLESAC